MQQPMDEELHTTEVWEVNQEKLQTMLRNTNNPPKLLTRTAGKTTCSIFRLPRSFKDINGKSYQPRAVSIGPYHRGDPNLKMIEEHKWVYLRATLRRLQRNDVSLEVLFREVHSQEAKARECYSEEISMSSDDFIEMMILDGCFIVELFRRFVNYDFDDPIFKMRWVIDFVFSDLLLVENQIPLFVLQHLFDRTRDERDALRNSLTALALGFFNVFSSTWRSEEVMISLEDLEGEHLLDLLRASYVKSFPGNLHEERMFDHVPLIYNLSKLRRSGIKIKLKKVSSGNFLEVSFESGVLSMPAIHIDGFSSSFLLNCVAYEQCQSDMSPHFTTYVTLLDCLVSSARDVEYLRDENIVEHYFGSDAELATFINTMRNGVTIDMGSSYLSELFYNVNTHSKNRWYVQVASFKYTYFDTPWSLISALAAGVLLLLTMAQTFFTIHPAFNK